MQPNDIISLRAFLKALSKLDAPLPPDIQNQLNAIAKNLETNPTQLPNLDIIAESYEPLDTAYQEELTILTQEAGIRSKGLPPLPLPKESNQELTNAAIDTFSADDSVKSSKKQPNLIKRVWQSIKGSH